MTIIQQQLTSEVCKLLKIEGNEVFSIGLVEKSIKQLDSEEYEPFFEKLMSIDNIYLKPLEKLTKATNHFKALRTDEILSESKTIAKRCYDVFYSLNGTITAYCQANRDKVLNDREFFKNIDYKSLKNVENELVLTKQQVYVLNKLGGGEWLINIKFIVNPNDIYTKIEKIIKQALQEKSIKKNQIGHIETDVKRIT